MVLGEKFLQEHPDNVVVSQSLIFGTTFLLLYINNLPNASIYNIAINIDDNTLSSKCD